VHSLLLLLLLLIVVVVAVRAVAAAAAAAVVVVIVRVTVVERRHEEALCAVVEVVRHGEHIVLVLPRHAVEDAPLHPRAECADGNAVVVLAHALAVRRETGHEKDR